MEKLDLKVIESSVCNTKYMVSKFSNAQCFGKMKMLESHSDNTKAIKIYYGSIDALIL